ncbi:MAG: hypothetical protein B6I31_05610 [Desulfobacteraceae bacterium 4572_19]|nr:MAG: hypothetical protein B6I31_05610 [Desulfobacteraceae bacterium 4572_19]
MQGQNRGWTVTFAGIGINLALGILYTWSIFKNAIMESVLAGTGIGFGYSAATPPALKWFPANKTGLIAGLVVSGFGLASVYIAPLSKYLLGIWGLQSAMLFFGITFILIVCALSMLLVNPPDGYVPESSENNSLKTGSSNNNSVPANNDVNPMKLFASLEFYLLWFIYAIGAGAGLMVIGSVAGMAKSSLGEYAFVVVAIMAIGNAGGRITAGVLSDKIGRSNTLIAMLLFQAILMLLAVSIMGTATAPAILVLLATFIGFNYGTNLSIFPSFTKDLWGLKNFGTNYGIVFTAWGVGGFFMSRLSQMLKVTTESFSSSFYTAAGLLVLGIVLTFILKQRLKKIQAS